MNYYMKVILVFIILMFPAIATSEVREEQECICDKSVDYSEHSLLSIADVHERLVNMSWPESTPILWFAKIANYAVFQIKVTASGEVCAIEFIGGSALVKAALINEVKKWKFRPGKPFFGLIAIRYETSAGFRLL